MVMPRALELVIGKPAIGSGGAIQLSWRDLDGEKVHRKDIEEEGPRFMAVYEVVLCGDETWLVQCLWLSTGGPGNYIRCSR